MSLSSLRKTVISTATQSAFTEACFSFFFHFFYFWARVFLFAKKIKDSDARTQCLPSVSHSQHLLNLQSTNRNLSSVSDCAFCRQQCPRLLSSAGFPTPLKYRPPIPNRLKPTSLQWSPAQRVTEGLCSVSFLFVGYTIRDYTGLQLRTESNKRAL